MILSSDEEIEDEKETGTLFREFLAKVGPFVDRTVVILLSMKFDESREAIGRCSTFRSLLQRKLRVVKEDNAYIHTAEICKELCKLAKDEEASKREICNETPAKEERSQKLPESQTACHGDSFDCRVTSTAGEFENENKGGGRQVSIQEPRVIDDIVIVEVPGTIGSGRQNTTNKCSSQATCSAQNDPNARAILSPGKRKKIVRRLEEKMKVVADQIRILNKAELSLDEMAMSDSTYLKESRLKATFNKYWNKICALQGKPPNTGRVTEKEVKIRSTGYPAIDDEVGRFLKKRKNFPDIFDVKEVVDKANKKYDLRISAPVLKEIAEEVFTNIGNRLQRRRKMDFTNNFGCALTDDHEIDQDPALHDPELQRKLQKNHKKSKRALNDVFRRFVHYDRLKYCDSGNDSASHSNDDNGKSSHRGTLGKQRKKLFSSSDSETDEELSQSSQAKENSDDDDDEEEEEDDFLTRHRKETSSSIEFHQVLETSDCDDVSQDSMPKEARDLDHEMSSPRRITTSPQSQPLDDHEPETVTLKLEECPQEQTSTSDAIEEMETSSKAVSESCFELEANSGSHSANVGTITIGEDANKSTSVQLKEFSSPDSCVVDMAPVKPEGTANMDWPGPDNEVHEADEGKAAVGCNGDGSWATRVTDSWSPVNAANASPVRCSVKLRPVCTPKPNKSGADLVTAQTDQREVVETLTEPKKGTGTKRSAFDSNGYESPLKLFRKATLDGILDPDARNKPCVQAVSKPDTSTNDQVPHNNYSGGNACTKSPGIAGKRPKTPDVTPRKALSLRKHADKTPNNKPITVIILSDDESD